MSMGGHQSAAADKERLTPWFQCGDGGPMRPVRNGWYQWQLWIQIDGGLSVVVPVMGWYSRMRDSVLIKGFRFISVRNGDCWRGRLME